MSVISKNIKRIREFSGLNQKDFAEKFGILGRRGKPSEDMLGTYERAMTPPPVELIKKLAAACSIDIKRITEEELKLYDLEKYENPGADKEDDTHLLSEPGQQYQKNDFERRYYRQLEENNRLLNNQVTTLQEVVKQTEQRLAKIEERQLTIARIESQAFEALLDFVAKQENVDPAMFRNSTYKRYPSTLDRALNVEGNLGEDNSHT